MSTATVNFNSSTAAAELSNPAHQAYRILHLGFTVAPVLAGIDKFFHVLCNWDQYLAPWVARLSPIGGHNLMLTAGAIEAAAGILVAVRPRLGAPVVGVWLCLIIANLLSVQGVRVTCCTSLPQCKGWLLCKPLTAIRKAVAARLFTGRVFADSFLPPLMSLSGHKPSQDANAAPLRNRERSGPTSASKVWAVKTLMPGMAVRSPPKIRYRCTRKSKLGSLVYRSDARLRLVLCCAFCDYERLREVNLALKFGSPSAFARGAMRVSRA